MRETEKVLFMIAKNPASHSTPLTNIRVPRISNKKNYNRDPKRMTAKKRVKTQERKVGDEIANKVRIDD